LVDITYLQKLWSLILGSDGSFPPLSW